MVLGPILERVSLIQDLNIVCVVLGPILERVSLIQDLNIVDVVG